MKGLGKGVENKPPLASSKYNTGFNYYIATVLVTCYQFLYYASKKEENTRNDRYFMLKSITLYSQGRICKVVNPSN